MVARLAKEQAELDAEDTIFMDLLSPGWRDAPPLTKYDHLYWDLDDAWRAYCRNIHDHLFPEFALNEEDD